MPIKWILFRPKTNENRNLFIGITLSSTTYHIELKWVAYF